jgi:Glycine rich protein
MESGGRWSRETTDVGERAIDYGHPSVAPNRIVRKQAASIRAFGLVTLLACIGSALLAAPALGTTQTFNYTGAVQTWTVPAGVTSASFDLFGAQGGGRGGPPGLGGHATATIPVSAGDSIQVNVGGQGQPVFGSGQGGFNGGGNGTGALPGSSGGGASDIRLGGTSLNHRVLVAGGGGGAGNCSGGGQNSDGGGGGGLNGADGKAPCVVGPPAGGGTQAMGGSGVSPGGSFGQGGNSDGQGGAGGGGWYGGGGGTATGGGGGGSGHGPAGTTFETGVRSGDGQVTITYTANPPAPAAIAAAEDPKCERLRKKLKRQRKNLAKAESEKKRSMISANIEDTERRLAKLGCK